ncbi:MAG: hypothetical protein NC222_06185 [Staphylococcus sp.]|nr:hypothetical protein [Staphylococcus sp.]
MILQYPDKILVENLCQGTQGKYKISWKPQVLATGYNIYRSRIPYGHEVDIVAENIPYTEYYDTDFDVIEGMECYYRVSSVMEKEDGTIKESKLSRFQTAQNTNEYMSPSEGTYLDCNNMIYDPHSNRFPTSEQEQNYIGVNYLPLNVMRRYQFNRIQRDEMWILQDRGEPVYFLKKKRVNMTTPELYDDRRQGRSDLVDFYQPLIIFAALASPGQTHIKYAAGTAIERQTRSWTLYTPELTDGDIIVDKTNKRWEIQNVTAQRSWRGAVTFQTFDIKELPITDPIYQHPKVTNLNGCKLYPKEHYWEREGI